MKQNLPAWTCALLLLMACGPGCTPARNETLPNVILIMADDMGFECLGAYGSLSYQTPHLDRLAANGIRFDHCVAQPLCTPSRVKIMTGLYNYRNYAHFGHLGLEHPTRPLRMGFEEYCLWQLTRTRSEGERYARPLIECNGKTIDALPEAYGPDVFSGFVLDFIDRHKDQPFFVYYPMVLVHDPFVPTPDSDIWFLEDARYQSDTAHFPAGKQKGIHYQFLIEFSDFYPTLAEIAGQPLGGIKNPYL